MKIENCNCNHCHHFKDKACNLGIYDKNRHDPATHYCINIFEKEIEKGGTCNARQ